MKAKQEKLIKELLYDTDYILILAYNLGGNAKISRNFIKLF
jgi:hypothetical protein